MSEQYDQEIWVESELGTQLWAASVGQGPCVVLCDGLGCDGFIWKHIINDLKRDHQVIRLHYRGHGRSGIPKNLGDMNVPGLANDVARVLDAFGVESCVLAGHSMGVQVLLEHTLYANPNERIKGLALLCGAAGRPLHSFKNSSVGHSVLPFILRLADIYPGQLRTLWPFLLKNPLALEFARYFEINRFLMSSAEMRPYLDRLAEMEPRVFLAMLEHAAEHSVEPQLHRISLPTLIVAAEHDTFTPLSRSVEMSEEMPNSQLFVLPSATHTGPLEWPELLNLRIRKFLRQEVVNY